MLSSQYVLSIVALNSMAAFMWPWCSKYELTFFNCFFEALQLCEGENKWAVTIIIIFSSSWSNWIPYLGHSWSYLLSGPKTELVDSLKSSEQ